MTHITLFSLGSPFGQWPSLAKSFLGEHLMDPAVEKWHQDVVGAPLPEVKDANALDALRVDRAMLEGLQALRPFQSPCWGGGDARLSWTGKSVAQLPNVKFMLWVEHPAHPLAHWLPAAGGADAAAAALALVESSMRGMVDLVHKHRSRCLVVYADEAAAHPEALAGRLQDWLGVAPERTALPAQRAPDPLYLLLSEQLVATSPRLVRDHERLYASCVPLTDSEAAPASRSNPLVLDAIKSQSRSREELTKERSGSDHLRAQLKQMQDKLEQAALKQRQDHDAAANSKDQVQARTATTKSEDPKRQTQEAELMLVQLHQVQEELEHYYRAYRDLQAVQSGQAKSQIARNKGASVEIGAERDTPPHRELSLVVPGLQVDQKKLGRLHVRLVEHHDRPGIVLLQPRKTPAPLAVWDPSGSEGEISFMLLIPTDEHGRQRLQRMGASDWRITESVVHCIEQSLESDSASATSKRWTNVARRLSRQFADLPCRFRFDRVEAVPDAQAPGAFIVTFGSVSFGSQYLPQVQLRWWPSPGEGRTSVELLRAADGEVPLPASWPMDHAGAWATTWAVPLGGASREALSRVWRSMCRSERDFLFGLLDALPAAPGTVTNHGQGAPAAGAGELAAAAAVPLKTAYRLYHGSRLRRVVQAVRGRIAA